MSTCQDCGTHGDDVGVMYDGKTGERVVRCSTCRHLNEEVDGE